MQLLNIYICYNKNKMTLLVRASSGSLFIGWEAAVLAAHSSQPAKSGLDGRRQNWVRYCVSTSAAQFLIKRGKSHESVALNTYKMSIFGTNE
jgi:hypothetical protein